MLLRFGLKLDRSSPDVRWIASTSGCGRRPDSILPAPATRPLSPYQCSSYRSKIAVEPRVPEAAACSLPLLASCCRSFRVLTRVSILDRRVSVSADADGS